MLWGRFNPVISGGGVGQNPQPVTGILLLGFNPVISGGGVGHFRKSNCTIRWSFNSGHFRGWGRTCCNNRCHHQRKVSIRSFPGVGSDGPWQPMPERSRGFNPVISGGGVGPASAPITRVSIRSFPGVGSDGPSYVDLIGVKSFNPVISGVGSDSIATVLGGLLISFNPVISGGGVGPKRLHKPKKMPRFNPVISGGGVGPPSTDDDPDRVCFNPVISGGGVGLLARGDGRRKRSFNPVISGGGVGRGPKFKYTSFVKVSIRSFPGVGSDGLMELNMSKFFVFQSGHFRGWGRTSRLSATPHLLGFNPVISGGGVGLQDVLA